MDQNIEIPTYQMLRLTIQEIHDTKLSLIEKEHTQERATLKRNIKDLEQERVQMLSFIDQSKQQKDFIEKLKAEL